MVCFTRSHFHFSRANAEHWCYLLIKYYADIPIEVNGKAGKCTEEFFQSVPEAPSYTAITGSFWSGYAAVRAMAPPPSGFFTPADQQSNNGVTQAIDAVIKGRLGAQENEIGIESDFKRQSFASLVQSFKNISSTEKITRLFVSNIDETIVLVLEDLYPIKITTDRVSDWNLPTFDPDDGFVTKSFDQLDKGPSEWAPSFERWAKRLIESDYASWDQPILPSA